MTKEKTALESLEELGLLGALNDSGVDSSNYKQVLTGESVWHKFTRDNPPPRDEMLMIHERKSSLYFFSSNKILDNMDKDRTITLRSVTNEWITHVNYDEMKDWEWKVL